MKIAVVIPAYRVEKHILKVVEEFLPVVKKIFVVDDACPNNSGNHVNKHCYSKDVEVVFHPENQGVGGAVISGYLAALAQGFDIIVKVDGDGQMDPFLLKNLIKPIIEERADYTKGNRFFRLEDLSQMPRIRLLGNALLSFINKASNGYWNIMDPTNGYTAIHRKVLQLLPLDKLDKGYFFESDMLFRLSTMRAVIEDVPMPSIYGSEESNIKLVRIVTEFPPKLASRFFKRFFYNYLLRDFNVGTLETMLGVMFLSFGIIFGLFEWISALRQGVFASTGTVMLAAVPTIIGVQLLLSAISFDVANIPKNCLHPLLSQKKENHYRRFD